MAVARASILYVRAVHIYVVSFVDLVSVHSLAKKEKNNQPLLLVCMWRHSGHVGGQEQ